LFPSLLKYRAAQELAELWQVKGHNDKAREYSIMAASLKKDIPSTFADGSGMLRASTGKSCQRDVWGTSLAVYYGILEGEKAKAAGRYLLKEWKADTKLFRHGNLRHVVPTDDFDSTTSWESSLVGKGNYQNGGYWGTPVGWVCYAMAEVDLPAARQLAQEYIADLMNGDFRRGAGFGAPWECYNDNGPQNPLYMTSVACPFIVFKEK
jgi:hypothetical protein